MAGIAGLGGGSGLGVIVWLISQATNPLAVRITSLEAAVVSNKAEVLKRIDDRFHDIEKIMDRAEERNAKQIDRQDRLNERYDLRLQNVELLVNGVKPKARPAN